MNNCDAIPQNMHTLLILRICHYYLKTSSLRLSNMSTQILYFSLKSTSLNTLGENAKNLCLRYLDTHILCTLLLWQNTAHRTTTCGHKFLHLMLFIIFCWSKQYWLHSITMLIFLQSQGNSIIFFWSCFGNIFHNLQWFIECLKESLNHVQFCRQSSK